MIMKIHSEAYIVYAIYGSIIFIFIGDVFIAGFLCTALKLFASFGLCLIPHAVTDLRLCCVVETLRIAFDKICWTPLRTLVSLPNGLVHGNKYYSSSTHRIYSGNHSEVHIHYLHVYYQI